MGKEHRLAERRQAILAALEQAGHLSVNELSARFRVSEVTVRNDLQALSAQGLLLRTRGGALATSVLPELSFDVRQQQQAEVKARIGRAAAALVPDGATIALDASTTAGAIIPYIRQAVSELTVVTNSLKAAMGLLGARQVNIIMPGGCLRHESISLVGGSRDLLWTDLHISIGFFGARGFTLEEGLTDVNLEEVRTKRALVARCQQVIGVIDARKWGQVATATFANLDQIDTIITDDAPPEMLEEVRRRKVEVILV